MSTDFGAFGESILREDFMAWDLPEPGNFLNPMDSPDLYEPIFREFQAFGPNIFMPIAPSGDRSLFIQRLTPDLYEQAARTADVWASIAKQKENEVRGSAPARADDERLAPVSRGMEISQSDREAFAYLYPGMLQELEGRLDPIPSFLRPDDDDIWERNSEHKSDDASTEPDDLLPEQDFTAFLAEPLPCDNETMASMEVAKPETIQEIEAQQFLDCEQFAASISEFLRSNTFLMSSPDLKEVSICTDASGQCHGMIVIEHDREPNYSYVRYLVTNPINIRSSVNDLEEGKKRTVGTLLMQYAEWDAAQKGMSSVGLNSVRGATEFYRGCGYENHAGFFYQKNLYRERKFEHLQLAM